MDQAVLHTVAVIIFVKEERYHLVRRTVRRAVHLPYVRRATAGITFLRAAAYPALPMRLAPELLCLLVIPVTQSSTEPASKIRRRIRSILVRHA